MNANNADNTIASLQKQITSLQGRLPRLGRLLHSYFNHLETVSLLF